MIGMFGLKTKYCYQKLENGYLLSVIGLFSHPLLVTGYWLLVIGLLSHPLLVIGYW